MPRSLGAVGAPSPGAELQLGTQPWAGDVVIAAWAGSPGSPSPFPSQQHALEHSPTPFLSSRAVHPELSSWGWGGGGGTASPLDHANMPPQPLRVWVVVSPGQSSRSPVPAAAPPHIPGCSELAVGAHKSAHSSLPQPLSEMPWCCAGALPASPALQDLQPPHRAWGPAPAALMLPPGCSAAGRELAGQVRRHASIFPRLPLPMPPVNMSPSDEKVNKFSSRLKVSIISFVSDK